MPLSAPVERDHKYSRTIHCDGFLRRDGLWDIEGHMHDVRKFPSVMPLGRVVPANVAVHRLAMRMTIDEKFVIRAIEVAMDATPYEICPNVGPNHQRLVGLSLHSGFAKKARDALAGADGCTHFREMLGPIATCAFQTVFNYRRATEPPRDESRLQGQFLNTCYAFAPTSPVIKARWPGAYTGS